MRPPRTRLSRQLDDPGYARVLGQLLTDARDTTLPTAMDLDAASQVGPADITRAIRLWRTAQRQADTGREGTL